MQYQDNYNQHTKDHGLGWAIKGTFTGLGSHANIYHFLCLQQKRNIIVDIYMQAKEFQIKYGNKLGLM